MDCGLDVWRRSVPQFEERQLGRLDAERRELLANYLLINHVDLIPPSFAFRALEVRTWKIRIDDRAVHRFGTGVWGPGFRSG
jgi:hypothetical protein